MKQDRLDQWNVAVQQEIKEGVEAMVSHRKKADEAKTSTKRAYHLKKAESTKQSVLKMLAAADSLSQLSQRS